MYTLIRYFLVISTRGQWHPTPVLLPGKSHGRRSLVGCSPCGREESDMTEWFHFHFWLSCTVEGNSNPLQCSCLENPRDRGAWWAAIYAVAQSWTRLKRLNISSIHLNRKQNNRAKIIWLFHFTVFYIFTFYIGENKCLNKGSTTSHSSEFSSCNI